MVAALLTSFLVARGLKSWTSSLLLVSTVMVESSMVTGWQWEALPSAAQCTSLSVLPGWYLPSSMLVLSMLGWSAMVARLDDHISPYTRKGVFHSCSLWCSWQKVCDICPHVSVDMSPCVLGATLVAGLLLTIFFKVKRKFRQGVSCLLLATSQDSYVVCLWGAGLFQNWVRSFIVFLCFALVYSKDRIL